MSKKHYGTNCPKCDYNFVGRSSYEVDGTKYPKISKDGDGGAIITWQHFRTAGDYDIHAQRINSTGKKQWGMTNDFNGTVICNDKFGDQQYPRVCSDENDGIIITWRDHRTTLDYDIYAQRINLTGQTYWTKNGTVICNETNHQGSMPGYGHPAEFSICSDGNNGAIITWRDNREDPDGDIYAQKINSFGITQWTNNGTLICNKILFSDSQNKPQICTDNNGGAIITWVDHRFEGGPTGPKDIYAQKINSIGLSEWIDNGTLVCNEANEQDEPQISSDGNGNAYITWQDERNDQGDIYIQLITSDGQIEGNINGTLICNGEGMSTEEQLKPQICNDGYGNVIIAWRDNRDDSSGDIFSQKINYLTKTGFGISSDDDDDDDKSAPIVPYGNFYLIFFAIGIISLSIFIRHKIKTKK